MTEIEILELMDAIEKTQDCADKAWRVLREILEAQHAAQQSVHPTRGSVAENSSSENQKVL